MREINSIWYDAIHATLHSQRFIQTRYKSLLSSEVVDDVLAGSAEYLVPDWQTSISG